MRKRQRNTNIEKQDAKRSKIQRNPASLLDIAAECVASNFPYQEVEEKIGFIPGPVQDHVMYHSFPKLETSIALYSSNKIHINATDAHKQPFHAGVRLLESQAVSNVVQIGRFTVFFFYICFRFEV